MSYGAQYTAQPPAYDEEAQEPFLNNTQDDTFKETVANSSVEIRMQFVRKVYSILTAQILSTIVMSSVFMYNTNAKSWVQSNIWALYVSMFLTFGSLIFLLWKSRSTPLNYYLLAAFTVAEGYLVGTVVTFYEQTVVLQALIITFGVFAALTLFTLQSKWDFSGMAPILFASLWVLILVGFVQIFFPFSEGFQLAIAFAGVLIFSGYIIFDTYMIFNRYSPEDYILASVSLYMDFINLFLRILQILSAMQRD
ncbi:inhibitor of apoptosis-promoting Bax1-domain-containing protein [Umbelopsis sp. PMI_123]|nr:inhibitor of apoptosis-promoting Bax1-domain-containing protein [Umbelopsis sp. PMI_123]